MPWAKLEKNENKNENENENVNEIMKMKQTKMTTENERNETYALDFEP